MAVNPSFKKRERERAQREKQQEKDRRRKERRDGKGDREVGPAGEDPDLIGIVPGPQPRLDEEGDAPAEPQP